MRYFIYGWSIIVGGLLIYLGWPPREPICIICGPSLALAAGVISVLVGIVGLVRPPERGANAFSAR